MILINFIRKRFDSPHCNHFVPYVAEESSIFPFFKQQAASSFVLLSPSQVVEAMEKKDGEHENFNASIVNANATVLFNTRRITFLN